MITIEAPRPADVPPLLQIIRVKAQFDKTEDARHTRLTEGKIAVLARA